MGANNEKRYAHGEVECIDAIRAALTDEEFRGFCKGNVMKYLWRWPLKGGAEDLRKCRQCIDYLIGEIESEDCYERGLKPRGTCTADLTDTFVTEDGIRVRQWECSECGHTFEDVYGEYEFCPRCGRRITRRTK